jgi:hypothetical protein
MTEANAGPVVQWQYTFVTKQTDSYLLYELTPMGLAGWELVSINFAKNVKGIWEWTAWLKRPVMAAEAGDAAAKAAGVGTQEQKQALQGFDLGDGDFGFKEGE